MKCRNILAYGAAVSALCGSAALAQSGPGVESVVVTGSRVISDTANSPTPVTIVSTEQLAATSPTNIPDGLNKLPVFFGSQTIGKAGDGTKNAASNILDLRHFGSQRTLILFDGHRAPPSNADGTVDIDSLPQMLVQRVDVVTGGASAVYGSDAVTGVVNFVLDRNFTGLKTDFNAGLSNYGDAMSYKMAVAAGSELFGGRGHVEGSVEYRHMDGYDFFSRPNGPTVYTQVGNGSAAKPYVVLPNGNRPNSSLGGRINNCVAPCSVNGWQFATDGVLTPFDEGKTTGTSNENSGGDGAQTLYSTAQDAYRQATAFGRFSYAINDTTSAYIQASGSEAYSTGYHFPQKLTPGSASARADYFSQAATFFKDNPFLSPTVQAQLGNNGMHDTSNIFQIGEFLEGLGQKELNHTTNVNRLLSMQVGLEGTLASRFNWNLFYTHGENRLAVDLANNQNYQKLYAASDAVVTSSGTIKCYAATQAATAAEYADCVPINPFGPTAITRNAFEYESETTSFHQTNVLDDVGAAISGPVWDGWAGPVTAALSGEARFQDYTVTANAPIKNVDCTGLRICSPSLPLYAQGVLAPVSASANVWEIAAEMEVPLLKDVPLARRLALNLAGRYTDYSTSGAVETWKVGLDYAIVDSLRLRGTTSIDIRAPTLSDFNQPPTVVVVGFNDLHTSINSTTFQISQGNVNLKPEVSRTYTVGAVWTPESVPNLTMSLDYFRIHMNNAIGSISPGSTSTQTLCEASGGTAPYCSLYQRPLSFSDRSPANYPTRIFALSLNTASIRTEGFDFETDYSFEMSDLVSGWAGSWQARGLLSYQPVLQSVAFPGAAVVKTIGPKTRATMFLTYTLNDWTIGLQDRWMSSFGKASQIGQVYEQPEVGSYNSIDVNITRAFEMGGTDLSAYFVVQNALNTVPPLYISSANTGYDPMAINGESIMGRYFTIGIRANL
jgi:outer membrane receptor protein involved in Fe transport